jgi:predicted N-acyltransferase
MARGGRFMSASDLELSVAEDLRDVPAAAWDALAGEDNPFVEHAFLASLEVFGCVGPKAGWVPRHLLVWQGAGAARRLVGAAPMYLKNNSYGEYIFDWAWADASQRAGVPYYPKLVSAVPFTPATGPRLLIAPDLPRAPIVEALASGARAVAAEENAWSVHWLFTEPGEVGELGAHGYLGRTTHQYHWKNLGFTCFDDYLAAMGSKRRKEVRRERRAAAGLGLDIAVEPGGALSEQDVADLYGCYRSTIDSRRAIPYLTPAWFGAIRQQLAARAVVVTVRRSGRLVAGALNFRKGDHLYGRYWGALEDRPALHFEVCYYQLIEYAIAEGITLFEAGAQGEHKITRGFLPSRTYSAHWLRHAGLARAVAEFLPREARHLEAELLALAEGSPYRAPPEAFGGSTA